MCLEAKSIDINGVEPSFQNCNDSINQKWRFVPSSGVGGGGTIESELFNSDICLDENGQDGTVYQWYCDGTSDQYFNILPLSTAAPSLAPICNVMNVVGQTIFIPGAGIPGAAACLKVQLAIGGTLEGDFSDSLCEKNESDWQSSAGVFSIFKSIVLDENTAVFIKGQNGYSGTFRFKENSAMTQPFLEVLNFNGNEKEFEFQVTIPTCSADAICPTMKVAL